MALIWSHQPFKAILTILTLCSTPIYMAALSIYYAPKSSRPIPSQSLRLTLINELLRVLLKYAQAIRLKPWYHLKAPKASKQPHVLVRPCQKSIYTGVLANTKVKPAPVGAFWYPRRPEEGKTKITKVILHFQGGGFVLAPDGSSSGEYVSSVFASQMGSDTCTFWAQYRVARDEQTRFPAALQDAITFYQYLLDEGFKARNILVSGDSAGGTLAIALLRFIESSNNLPTPRGVMAWSPWVNITPSAVEAYRMSPLNKTDYLPWQLLQWGLESYPPLDDAADAKAYVSPLTHPFRISCPLFLHAGAAEIFHDDIKAFADEMALPGNRVKFLATPGAPHALIQIGKFAGLDKETQGAAAAAHLFFDA